MKTLAFITSLVFFSMQFLSAQNFWQQTNGPYNGATVYDFLSYNDSTLFIATEEGLIKSTDNGISWTRLNSNNVTCLGIDKLNTLYYGISGHLKRSTDDGNTWTDIPVPAAIKDFVITFKDTIFVGSWNAWSEYPDAMTLANGVYRSFDYGNTWTLVNNGIQYPGVYEMIILSNNSILVGTSGGGVYKSTNWGDNWSASNSGLPIAGNYIYAESFIEFTPGQVLTGVHTSIYYSSNYGDTWSFSGSGYNNNIATCFEIDEVGTIYAGSDLGDGVYYSTNNGNDWNFLGLGISTRMLGWDSESRLYAGSLSSGLYRYSFTDSTWNSVYNRGYTPAEVDHLWITDNGNLIAGTHWWGLNYTTDSGETWKRINSPAGFNAIETINDSIFVGGGSAYIYVSYDTGKTWQVTGNFDSQSLYYDPTEQIVYLGTKSTNSPICGVYTSNDFGQTWSLLYDFPHINLIQQITNILVTRNDHTILASQRASAPYSVVFILYQSTDSGISWQVIYQDYNQGVTSIIQDANSTVFVAVGGKLMISENEGQTWLTRISSVGHILTYDYSGRIYTNNGVGIKYSTDKGISWIPANSLGLNNLVNDIVIDQNERIYLGTSGGIFYAEADSIVVSVENREPIKSFYLSQNYPNPFNPSTKIKFVIPAVGTRDRVSVQLKVYDVLGNGIATLVNEEKQPGIYEVEFNVQSHSGEVRNLTSGIYFYQLRAGNYIETKKMVLLK